jgi:hypothetical protein
MLTHPRILTLAALLLIGGSALWLDRLRSAVHLGKPGVRMSSMPVLSEDSKVVRSNSVALPTVVPGFETQLGNITQIELEYLPPDTSYARRTYSTRDGSFSTQASAVLMGTDRTSIHRPEYCLTGQGWNIRSRAERTIRIGGTNGYDLPVQRYDMQFHGEVNGRAAVRAGVYVFWFVADNQLTASHVERQWWLIRDLLFKRTLQRWAYISFFTDCAPGEEDATYARVSQLAAAIVPEFQLTSPAPP